MALSAKETGGFNSGVEIHPTASAIQEGFGSDSWNGDGEGHFAIPYHKPVNGQELTIWFRWNHYYASPPMFSIDLGSNGARDSFISVGSVDFTIEQEIAVLPNGIFKTSSTGLLNTGNNIRWAGENFCYRERKPAHKSNESEYSNHQMGIFVEEEFRGKGLAHALLSSSRIVLASRGIRHLLIDGIKSIDPNSGTGGFYRSLGAPILYLPVDAKRNYPKIVLPTEPTNLHPYRFK